MRIADGCKLSVCFLAAIFSMAAVGQTSAPSSAAGSRPATGPASKPTTNQTGPDIVGAWQGTLNVGVPLRLIIRITREEGGALSALLDSPDQGANGLAVSNVTFSNGELSVESKVVRGAYDGKWNAADAVFEGTWKQGGGTFPLTLKKLDKLPELKRPQDPAKPYPYKEEEVSVDNTKDGVTLGGTLTLPVAAGPFAAVVLITGSGAQDRDEALMGHRPFLVLADHLTRKGIAVLRCDDRGVGKSTGSFATSTSEDFANDAQACVAFLKKRPEIDGKRIGLCGHSEGGLIAPIVAARSSDVAFIVLMAGTGVPGDEILYAQGELIARAGGAEETAVTVQRKSQETLFKIIRNEPDAAKCEIQLREAMAKLVDALSEAERKQIGDVKAHIEAQVKTINSPWFRMFLTFDPRPTLAQVKCPVLAINGEKDLQVPPKQNLPEIEKALKGGGNQHYSTKELPGLNHLFQTAKTGSPAGYSQIEETISPSALETISEWILKTTKQ